MFFFPISGTLPAVSWVWRRWQCFLLLLIMSPCVSVIYHTQLKKLHVNFLIITKFLIFLISLLSVDLFIWSNLMTVYGNIFKISYFETTTGISKRPKQKKLFNRSPSKISITVYNNTPISITKISFYCECNTPRHGQWRHMTAQLIVCFFSVIASLTHDWRHFA